MLVVFDLQIDNPAIIGPTKKKEVLLPCPKGYNGAWHALGCFKNIHLMVGCRTKIRQYEPLHVFLLLAILGVRTLHGDL